MSCGTIEMDRNDENTYTTWLPTSRAVSADTPPARDNLRERSILGDV